ncbi:hypothetical protein NFI96_028993 [Prochilodus magdalenae]|nr:hypothetical protein NFI96_028993 [Prochilodus magdalenae]
MRPSGVVLSRFSWTPWMWSLTLGCIAGSVWSASSGSAKSDSSGAAGAAGPPGASASINRPEQRYHGSQIHHSAPISIYRSPASLRSGHANAITALARAIPHASERERGRERERERQGKEKVKVIKGKERGSLSRDVQHILLIPDFVRAHQSVCMLQLVLEAKDCNGVVPDRHGVTQNGSGSSSVTSPAFVLVETPNESVTVVCTKMNANTELAYAAT